MDYEDTVQNLKPTVRWEALRLTDPYLDGYKAHEGFMTVPSDYSSPSSPEVKLYCQRFTKKSTTIPKIHVIFLTGGPGFLGETERWHALYYMDNLPELDLAVYTIDHRGLGRSSPFVAEGIKWFEIRKNLDNVIAKGPFPVKDLTLKNAALDNGYLAIAIKNDPEFPADGRLIVSGASYGATLAHQTVKHFPNLFYSGIFKLTPATTADYGSFKGLAESCALDEYCQSKVGGNVYEELKKAVRRVATIETNECTKMFSQHLTAWYSESDYRERVITLSTLIRPLMLDEGKEFEVNAHKIRHSQLIIPFLKATSDCPNPANYIEQVLKPMAPHFNSCMMSGEKKLILGSDFSKYNKFVNVVVSLDINDTPAPWKLSDTIDDFCGWLPCTSDYGGHYIWDLNPYLKDRETTDTSPLQTYTTKIYMMHRRMDLITPYSAAYELYKQINAPEKHWLLLNNSGHHDDTGSRCSFELGHDAIDSTRLGDLTACVEAKNREEALDWTFSGNPNLAGMWEHVVSAGEPFPLNQQLSGVPNLEKITTDPLELKKSFQAEISARKFALYKPYLIVGIAGLALSLMIAFAYYYLFVRNSKQKSDLEKDLDINSDVDTNA